MGLELIDTRSKVSLPIPFSAGNANHTARLANSPIPDTLHRSTLARSEVALLPCHDAASTTPP